MPTSNNRFLSLDIFRGMTICFMIIVNTPGSGVTPYSPLMHAAWNGLTPTDLIFPSFLFAVGNAMSFSEKKYDLLPESSVLIKIFKRTLLIFLIGFLIYWFPFFKLNEAGNPELLPLSNTRIMGVLQRIALCYLLASLLIRYFSSRKVIFTGIFILIGYWLVLYLCGTPGAPYSIQGNSCLFLDRFLFNEKHLYREGGIVFDPEGILGTLPAMVNVLIGYYAGKFIQEKGKTFESVAKLLIVGSLFIFVALWWNMVFPINKNLWTSPFVLVTTGIDLLVIGILIYITEISTFQSKSWTNFFIVFGKNPLFIYIISVLIRSVMNRIPVNPRSSIYEWINNEIFQKIASGPLGSLLFSLTFMGMCWLIVLWMDKRKIYVRL